MTYRRVAREGFGGGECFARLEQHKPRSKNGGSHNEYFKGKNNKFFLRSRNFELVTQINGNSINFFDVFKSVVCVRARHCV